MAADGTTANGHAAGIFSRHSVCLVLDYGSQYTQLIARRVRENGVLSMLLPGDVTMVRARKGCIAPDIGRGKATDGDAYSMHGALHPLP